MLGLVGTVFSGIANIGKTIIKGRKVFKGDAEAAQVREATQYTEARKFKPDGWLGKQIRPLLTLVIMAPIMVIAIAIAVLVGIALYPVITGEMTVQEGIAVIKPIFGLFDALSENYHNLSMLVLVFWFGGRIHKYQINSSEVKHAMKMGTDKPNKQHDLESVPNPPLTKLQKFQKSRNRD
ncbi:MAG: hypothetical protein K0U41_00685 [Gammaproteobacteria bacterium]|nr:hypothetical protein [Gammaproteobacteria bacterium]